MIPFMGLDVTTNKNNEEFNGSIFLKDEPSLDMTESWENTFEEVLDVVEKSQQPLYIRIIRLVCGGCALLIAMGIIKALGEEDVTLAKAYENAGFLFWIAGICAIVWCILAIMGRRKAKEVTESQKSVDTMSQMETISQNILLEMGVPMDEAKEVDILSFCYKIKNGNLKVVEKFPQMTPYNNLIFNIYKDEENLYFVNMEGKYQMPLASLRAIKTIKKSISIPSWSKDVPPNKGEYKKYKLTVDQYECIHMKPYYILELEYQGELWGIYFPSYELPIFESLTGLTAE